MATNTIKKLGWHFLHADMTLGFGDNRKATVGGVLSIPSHLSTSICNMGMHASETPAQASVFKKGPVITRVEVFDDVIVEFDKFCGRSRRVIWAHRLSHADVKKMAKDCSCSSSRFGSQLECNISDVARNSPTKFNAWIQDLMSGRVKVGKPAPVRPHLTEKAVLDQLLPRTIRTKKEVMKEIGSLYDLTTLPNYTYVDRFDEIVSNLEGVKVIAIEDFTASGDTGYVLKPRAR